MHLSFFYSLFYSMEDSGILNPINNNNNNNNLALQHNMDLRWWKWNEKWKNEVCAEGSPD